MKTDDQTKPAKPGCPEPPGSVTPCPFCGSHDVGPAGYDAWWQMLCNHCHAAGPSAGNQDDAQDYWNARSPNDKITDGEH